MCPRDRQTMLMFLFLLLLIATSLATDHWGAKVGRERVSSLRRGEGREGTQGTYNPRSAWMFVDSRRRVLPDIDGTVYSWSPR